MHQPRTPHWQAMKQVICNLKGTINQGLWFALHTISSSITYLLWFGLVKQSKCCNGVFWDKTWVLGASKKQNLVSRSSTEVEYHSKAFATVEIYWLRMLFKELVIGLVHISTIRCDSIRTISLASNLVFHARTNQRNV